MNNSTITRVVILGALAILLVIGTQTFWVLRTWDLTERNFDHAVNIALLNVAKEISVVNQALLPQQNLIKPLSSNTYAVNVNSQIDAKTLDFYLRKNIEQVALNEDFDYSIYDCHDEKMVYGRYITFSAASDSAVINKNFPKLDNPGANYYFVVRFPKRTSYLIGSMSFTLVFTGISLFTVLFFIYSLTVILRQKRLSELQRDFINNMTHEFKTPISTIKVASDFLATYPTIVNDARLSKYTAIMREQNNRLNMQVEKVLQINRLDKNSLQINPETINLHELLHVVLPTIQVKIEQLNGTLIQKLEAKQPYIKADVLHLTNILHNLLDNAIKYSKEGEPHISVVTEDSGAFIRLLIKDEGIGISNEHHKKVFYRFYRVSTGDIHNVKGFGLGLYYVKNIAHAHHWRITLASEINKGTSIAIDIPRVLEIQKTSSSPAVISYQPSVAGN